MKTKRPRAKAIIPKQNRGPSHHVASDEQLHLNTLGPVGGGDVSDVINFSQTVKGLCTPFSPSSSIAVRTTAIVAVMELSKTAFVLHSVATRTTQATKVPRKR